MEAGITPTCTKTVHLPFLAPFLTCLCATFLLIQRETNPVCTLNKSNKFSVGKKNIRVLLRGWNKDLYFFHLFLFKNCYFKVTSFSCVLPSLLHTGKKGREVFTACSCGQQVGEILDGCPDPWLLQKAAPSPLQWIQWTSLMPTTTFPPPWQICILPHHNSRKAT